MAVVASVVLFMSCPGVLAGSPTILSINTSQNKVTVGAQIQVNGTLSTFDSTGLNGQIVNVQVSRDGNTWTSAGMTFTNKGNYQSSRTLTELGDYYFRAVFAGSRLYNPAMSAVTSVTVNPPGPSPNTTLNLTASPASIVIGEFVTLSGRLVNSLNGEGLGGKTVRLDQSPDGIQFAPVRSIVTFSDGTFSLRLQPNTSGMVYYRAQFTGTSDYNSSASQIVRVTIQPSPGKEASLLTINASPEITGVNVPYFIHGFLNNSVMGTGISGQFISVEILNDNNTWSPVGLISTETDGSYSLSQVKSVAANYSYRSVFSGSSAYKNATSSIVTVNVTATSTIPTLLTLNVTPSEITLGESIRITGNLTENKTARAVSGESINIHFSSDNVSWKPVSTLITDEGYYETRHTPITAGRFYYKAFFSGTTILSPSQSRVVNITVNPVTPLPSTNLSLSASPGNPSLGATITFTGRLRDSVTGNNITGRMVTLQESRNTTQWNPVKNTITQSDGLYTILYTPTSGGTFYFRSVFISDAGYNGSVSPTIQISIKKPSRLTMNLSPSVIQTGNSLQISGYITDATTSAGLQGETIRVLRSRNATTWIEVNSTLSGINGYYTTRDIPPGSGTFYYVTTYAGSKYFEETTSNSVGVYVKTAP